MKITWLSCRLPQFIQLTGGAKEILFPTQTLTDMIRWWDDASMTHELMICVCVCAMWTHIDHLFSALVDRAEVWPRAVGLRKRSQTNRTGFNLTDHPLLWQMTAHLCISTGKQINVTDVITLKYCTLSSSAPDSTEELMRHSGSPLKSETRWQKHGVSLIPEHLLLPV